MFLNYLVLLLTLVANCCLSHDASQEDTHGSNSGVEGGSSGVKGGRSRQGIKSYGGYIHDHGQSQNQNGHTAQYHQPQFFQPYGWNFNQPQRTYGGMIQQNYPNNQPQQGFGWFGGENQQQGNSNNINNQNNGKTPLPPAPPAPSTPSLFLPNFAPPVYYPNTYPYPNYNFPNFNSYPFAPPYNPNHPNGNGQAGGNHNNGQNAVGQNEKNPDVNINRGPNPSQALTTTTQPSIKVNENESHNRHEGQDDDKFLTNAFFGGNVGNDEGSQKVNREWTEADEMKWQATTKAPYFENKVPGLDHCTLPASAVLGATTAFKASSLLPLNVPIGKPILSCNATELLQAQINLQGIIYDCKRSSITMSCPRLDANNLVIDDCEGETLECDVRMRQNTRSVSCTNGTLISNHPIICKSATLMESKNILNCLYKGSSDETIQTGSVPTTPRPVPHSSLRPPTVHESNESNESNVDDVYVRVNPDGFSTTVEPMALHNEVMNAIQYVFPKDLLSITAARQYLPPQSAAGEITDELKTELDGVFPHELFAMSQKGEANNAEQNVDNVSRLSPNRKENTNNRNQSSFSENQRSQWDLNLTRKTGNPGSSFKTNSKMVSETQNDNHNAGRLIFSP